MILTNLGTQILLADASTPSKPYRAPKLSEQRAALSRRIGAGCHSRCGNRDEVTVSLQLMERFPDGATGLLELHGPHGTIECADGARLMRALTGVDIDAVAEDACMAWSCVEAAVLGRLKDTPFDTVDGVRRVAAVAQREDLVALGVTLYSESYRISTFARADAATWLDFLENGDWVRSRAHFSDLSMLACVFPLRVARHALPVANLREVKIGDVFVPAEPNFTCEGSGRIAFGGKAAQAIFLPSGGLQIDSIEPGEDASASANYRHEENGNMNMQAIQAPDDEATSLDEYSVTLDFEVGKLHMTFGELRTLCAGTVLSITGGSPAHVAIRAGGRLLGRGEIVEVDGQLGIRVTHWLERRDGTA